MTRARLVFSETVEATTVGGTLVGAGGNEGTQDAAGDEDAAGDGWS